MSQLGIEFTNRNYLRPFKEQTIYPVVESDLQQLEKMIDRMDRRDADYKNWGIGMLGVSIGALNGLISLFYVQGASVKMWVISWLIVGVPFAVAAFALNASRHERHRLRTDKQDVLDYLQRIKDSVQAPEAAPPAPSA